MIRSNTIQPQELTRSALLSHKTVQATQEKTCWGKRKASGLEKHISSRTSLRHHRQPGLCAQWLCVAMSPQLGIRSARREETASDRVAIARSTRRRRRRKRRGTEMGLRRRSPDAIEKKLGTWTCVVGFFFFFFFGSPSFHLLFLFFLFAYEPLKKCLFFFYSCLAFHNLGIRLFLNWIADLVIIVQDK